jgi:hypothetical protein
MKYQALILIESRLDGVNRRNLKFIYFEHELHSGLELEISNNEIGVQKRVLLAMSCSINMDDFGVVSAFAHRTRHSPSRRATPWTGHLVANSGYVLDPLCSLRF